MPRIEQVLDGEVVESMTGGETYIKNKMADLDQVIHMISIILSQRTLTLIHP